MSYEINNITIQSNQIQKAQSMLNNGGGGNLGYFQGQKKKKNSEHQNSVFEETTDEFVSSVEQDTKNAQSDPGIIFNGKRFRISDTSFAKLKQLLKKLDID